MSFCWLTFSINAWWPFFMWDCISVVWLDTFVGFLFDFLCWLAIGGLAGSKRIADKHECAWWWLLLLHASIRHARLKSAIKTLHETNVMLPLLSQVFSWKLVPFLTSWFCVSNVVSYFSCKAHDSLLLQSLIIFFLFYKNFVLLHMSFPWSHAFF